MKDDVESKFGSPIGAANWSTVQRQSISGNVVEQILSALFQGELEPGQFLGTEKTLCEAFGVTRLPLRDAIKRLEAMGVVFSKPGSGGGIRVAKPDPDRMAELSAVQFSLQGVSVEELFDARAAIQPQAAELAAQNATYEDIAKIRNLIESAEGLLRKDETDFSQLADVFLETHFAIVAASKNRVLISLMQGLLRVAYSTYLRGGRKQGAEQGISGLTRIVTHIENRDGEGARTVTREHLASQRAEWMQRMGAPTPTGDTLA